MKESFIESSKISEVEKVKNYQTLKVSQHLVGNPRCKIALVPAHFCTEVSELLVEMAEDLLEVFSLKINSSLPNTERFCEVVQKHTDEWIRIRGEITSFHDLLKKAGKEGFLSISLEVCNTSTSVAILQIHSVGRKLAALSYWEKSRHSKVLSKLPGWKWRTEAQRAGS